MTLMGTALFAQTLVETGFLRDHSGAPVSGNVMMHYSIYKEPTGGSPLWDSGPVNVMVHEGLYTVSLGTPANPIDESIIATSGDYFMDYSLDGDPFDTRTSIAYSARSVLANRALIANKALNVNWANISDKPGILESITNNWSVTTSNYASTANYAYTARTAQSAMDATILRSAISIKTDSIEVSLSDSILLVDAAGQDVTLTLPLAQTVSGREYRVKKVDLSTHDVWIRAQTSENIDNVGLYRLTCYGEYVVLVSDGKSWAILGGN